MNEWCEKEIPISQIESLIENGYEIEVESPDGWVPVDGYVNKGLWEECVLHIEGMSSVRCNENHLFETDSGWVKAKDSFGKNLKFLTRHGMQSGIIEKTENLIPIVDIHVNHPNHRYFTENVSSHNTGGGKSLFMCHYAASCLSRGKNVLYITMELAEEEVAKRIDANLLNVTFDDLMTLSKDMYVKRVENVRSKTNGKLIVKEYPTASASVIHFKALLNELMLKKSFAPDVIFVDYMNICTSARIKQGAGVNSYTYVKAIAEELRGLAVEQDVPLFTATQVNRTGFMSSDVGLEDTSESFGTTATADFMFALINTEELQDLGQIMVKQLKNRFADPSENKRFAIGIDRSKMRLYDLEGSAQVDIADSGQIPQKTFGSAPSKDKFKQLKVN